MGFRQGVTAVERLRTYKGKPFAVADHLSRFEQTTSYLQIDSLPSKDTLAQRIDELLQRNSSLLRTEGDVGVTLFATPGLAPPSPPTIALHLNPIDHDRVDAFQKIGQRLVITDVCQPPDSAWSRQIKVRCRIHYYRADLIARNTAAGAIGVLVDEEGTITETGISNLAIVEDGVIYSPQPDQVLAGITQLHVERAAARLSLPWRRSRISVDRFAAANEILCMGTDIGVWFGRLEEERERGKTCEMLQNEFSKAFG